MSNTHTTWPTWANEQLWAGWVPDEIYRDHLVIGRGSNLLAVRAGSRQHGPSGFTVYGYRKSRCVYSKRAATEVEAYIICRDLLAKMDAEK